MQCIHVRTFLAYETDYEKKGLLVPLVMTLKAL